MTKKRNTKSALISSVLVLVLCCSMLVGTTFAWFTDSVSTGSNVIQSGKLDVDLVDANGASMEGQIVEFVAADGRAQDAILWEPGCTYETEPVYVVNKGNLALKYEIIISGIVGNAKLLEVIEWTVTVNGTETALADLKGNLPAGEKSGAIVLTGHMKESAGNEYQNLTVEGISISVLATQYTAESDSYDDQYDADAVWADYYVTNQAELDAAIEEGGLILLMNDITLTSITVEKGESATINMNGYDIIATSTKDSGNQAAFKVNGDLTVTGNGVVSMKHTGADMGWGALTAAFSVEGGSLTLEKGVGVVHYGGSAMSYAVDVNSTGGNTSLTVNGAVLCSTYTGVRLFNNHSTATATVTLNSGAIGGGRRDIWAHNPSAKAVDANGVVNVASTYEYDITVQDAESFYGRIYEFGDIWAETAEDAQTILDNLKNGETLQLVPGVEYGTLEVRAQVGAENKAPVITNANTVKVDYFPTKYPKGEFTRTFEDVTISGAPGADVDAIKFVGGVLTVDGVSGSMYQFVEIKNLVIDGIEFTDDSTVGSSTRKVSPLFMDLTTVKVDGLTVQNCTLEGNVNNMNLVYAYGAATNNCDFGATLNDVKILNNTVSGIARLANLRAANNVTISGNTASNLTAELALLENDPANTTPYSGNIVVSNNTVDNLDGYVLRVGIVGDALVTVENNTVTNGGYGLYYVTNGRDGAGSWIDVTDSVIDNGNSFTA